MVTRLAWLGACAVLLLASGCPRFQQPTVAPGERSAGVVETDGRTFFVDQGGRVHYRVVGSGPPILFVHGFASSMVVWDGLVRTLGASRTCILVDLPGFGLSDKHERDYSPEALADTLALLLRELGIAGPVDVVAHSWGSSVTLALALRHPERVGRIVLTSAWIYAQQLPLFFEWARIPGIGEALWGWFYTEQPGYKFSGAFYDPDRFASPAVEDLIREAFRRPGAVRAALEAARGQRFEALERRYPTIVQPALLIWGREDQVSEIHFAERLNAELPNSVLQVLAQCGHMPMLEHPARYGALVHGFLGVPWPVAAAAGAEVTP